MIQRYKHVNEAERESTVCSLNDKYLELLPWIESGKDKGSFETEEDGERIAIGGV